MRQDSQIGIVRDNRFMVHRTGPFHPEQPKRLKAVYRMLDEEFSNHFAIITPQPAKTEWLNLVHTPDYIEQVRQTSERSFSSLAPDTPVSSKTYFTALLAVGGCIQALDLLFSRECSVCFCFVRPPGHHSLSDRTGGYCVFNNLGVTARYALKFHPVSRILIIDWDIHHGNGIESLFYHDADVLYFSSHDILLYPNTGKIDDIGANSGKGYTVNVPLPREFEDADLYLLYRNLLESIVKSYQPELILVAAGFDGHYEDDQSMSKFTEQVFMHLTQLLMILKKQNGDPPLLFALEGGYRPKALVRCVRSVLTALTEKEVFYPIVPNPSSICSNLIESIRSIHSPYHVWTS